MPVPLTVRVALCCIPLVLAAFCALMLITHDATPANEQTTPGLPAAEAETAEQKPTQPTIQDANPTDWYGCMDRAFELSNHSYLIYSDGTWELSDDRLRYTESTYPVANMMWYIAVCDRMFPEAP